MSTTVVPPEPKERGVRPDPLTHKKDYSRFKRKLFIFFEANKQVYDADHKKILFTLGLLAGDSPGAWADNYVTNTEKKRDPTTRILADADWGTWKDFTDSLDKSFQDPNIKKSAYNSLQVLQYGKNRSADEFFQEFETLASDAGYATNDEYLIDLIEQKVPRYLLEKVYMGTLPTTYITYRDKIVDFDNLNQRLRAVHAHHDGSSGCSSYHPAPGRTDRKVHSGTVYGGQGQPMEIGRQRPQGRQLWVPRDKRPSNTMPRQDRQKPATPAVTSSSTVRCYGCGKEGHIRKDCPLERKQRRDTLRAFIQDIDDNDKDLIKGFLNV